MNPTDIITRIADQGFGYVLFVGALIVILFMWKENQKKTDQLISMANQRVVDLIQARDAYAVLSDTATKVAENTFTIVQNIQQLLNNLKK